MKKILLLLILFSWIAGASAQIITYDTIQVSPDDSRNIHRTQTKRNYDAPEAVMRTTSSKTTESGNAFDRNKLRFGANIGLSLSRNYTVLGLGPQVGYQFSDKVMLGAGAKYYYTKHQSYTYKNTNNLLGVNLFGYFYPIRFIAVFAQPELNYIWSNLTYKESGEQDKTSGLVPSLVVGAGLRLGRSHITINYDVVRHSNSPYPQGYFVGFSTFF